MKYNMLERYKLNKRTSRLNSKVFEAKQVGTLYHVCSLKDYLKYILPNDTLQASGMYYNFAYGGDYYVSFTRDKSFVVESRDDETILIQLVVDGDKLSENYKVRPYNDFAFGEDGERKHDDFRKREMEECVKGPIKNISKYIKEVRFDIASMHDLTQELNLNTLKRKKKLLKDIVYHKFIRGRSADLGIANGTPLKDVLDMIDDWVDSESIQEMLFSYDEDDIEDAIESGADVNKRHSTDGYPLEYYCEDDDSVPIIKMLLKAGANPNVLTKDKLPLLCYAIDCICENIVKVLIKSGADVNAKDIEGKTALMHAVETENLVIIKALLKAGANVNAKDNRGRSALNYTDNDKIIKLLEKSGAKL